MALAWSSWRLCSRAWSGLVNVASIVGWILPGVGSEIVFFISFLHGVKVLFKESFVFLLLFVFLR